VDCGDTTANTILVVVAILVVAALVAILGYCVWQRVSPETIARLQRLDDTYTPGSKLKIVFVFYQIATAVPRVYDVSLPPDVDSSLATISIGVSFGLTGIATTPLECVGLAGYVPRLVFWMAVPIAITVVIVCCVLLSSIFGAEPSKQQGASLRGSHNSDLAHVEPRPRLRRMTLWATRRHNVHGAAFHLQNAAAPQRPPNSFEQVLTPVMYVMFVLYPKVTNVAFEGFPCCAPPATDQTRGLGIPRGLH
jgi:hypothetical protein